MDTTITTDDRPTHDWHEAGDAWGHAAAEWSCLMEHYSLDLLTELLPRLDLRPGTRLLDVACGSGLFARIASARGAEVSAIDAAPELLRITRTRVPGADVRLGSMFELPWDDATFDTVVSVNGIWGGCQDALDEMARVARPGAIVAISFWGSGPPLDMRPCFKVFANYSPDPHVGSMRRLNDIATPGVAEDMLEASGLEVLERGNAVSVLEWPDAELAWRALSSSGPAVPALRADAEAVRREVLAAIEPCRDTDGIYRFRNDHQFVVARR